MLEDVEVVMTERCLVETGHVPDHDRTGKQYRRGERPRHDPAQRHHPPRPQQRPDDVGRRPVEQQRREHQRQEQVLPHVRAEQIGVGEVVERAIESQEQHDERPAEARDAAPCRRETA